MCLCSLDGTTFGIFWKRLCHVCEVLAGDVVEGALLGESARGDRGLGAQC